jgi:DnaJ-class molecular chaperone
MSWQKCPVCNGTGVSYGGLSSSATCPTCNGQRIISELTGKPPAYEIKTGVTTGTRPCIGYEPLSLTGDACKNCGKGKWYHTIF